MRVFVCAVAVACACVRVCVCEPVCASVPVWGRVCVRACACVCVFARVCVFVFTLSVSSGFASDSGNKKINTPINSKTQRIYET